MWFLQSKVQYRSLDILSGMYMHISEKNNLCVKDVHAHKISNVWCLKGFRKQFTRKTGFAKPSPIAE